MAPFGWTTNGAEVVAAFPEKVAGKTFAITGPSAGGLGAQTAKLLAAGKPAKLFLLGRTESKITPVIDEIKAISASTNVKFVPLDLGNFESVRKAAATIKASTSEIDVLINNAGLMALPTYTKTSFGLEAQFGSNHIGHFLLTNLLMPLIVAAGDGARIVNVASDGFALSEVRFDDYNFDDGKVYDKWSGYGQSKTANILFAVALAVKLGSKGISAYSIHPGMAMTNLAHDVDMSEWQGVFQRFVERGFPKTNYDFKSLEQATSTTLCAALDPSLKNASGSYLEDCAVAKAADYATDPDLAEKLWELSLTDKVAM
ncbi:hypothetical protein B7494_g5634 [Chlorociboria aeruginascens]|nr:hypothetical protein B7494_g5634 [Chlorociboria aeruginascens]